MNKEPEHTTQIGTDEMDELGMLIVYVLAAMCAMGIFTWLGFRFFL